MIYCQYIPGVAAEHPLRDPHGGQVIYVYVCVCVCVCYIIIYHTGLIFIYYIYITECIYNIIYLSVTLICIIRNK